MMKLKLVILLFMFLHFTFLISETIIDSVYSDPLLDGYIYYSQNAQAFSVNNWMYDMPSGDTWGVFPISPDYNSYFRAFISFDLPEIPENYNVDSVFVRIYQYLSGGYDASTGNYTDFPVWNVTGGDTIKCILSHIDYGNELDVGDWEKGDVGNQYTFQNNIGTVTESGDDGYRYIDVTSSIIQDYNLNRDKTQYRIAFQIDTDWDDWDDSVVFKTSNSQVIQQHPQIFIRFTDEINSTDDELILSQSLNIENYPNPFNPVTAISYQIPHPGIIKIKIFNIKGQLIKTLINEFQSAGKHSIIWDAKKQSSGVYMYRIIAGATTQTGKCLLLK